jgi:Tfp pilus assembly protein PilO
VTGRARIVVAIVVVVAVCVAFFFLFVRDRQAELSEVRDDIEAARDETQRLEVQLSRLRDLQDNAAKLNARLVEIRKLIPQDDEVAQFIFQVQDEANRAGVRFVEITPELPKPPPEGAQVAEIRVIVGANGDYFAVQDFLRRLYELERALRIDIIAMTGVEDEETGEVTIDLQATSRIFFEIPPGAAAVAPAPGGAPAPGATPAPGETPAPAATPAP